MATIKAGCFLVDKNTKKLALIYRAKKDDYSFPKGHAEEGEDVLVCAIRETEEETKRVPIVQQNLAPFVEKYTTDKGEECECYMFFAIDGGKSDNNSTDTHDVVWTDIDKVEQTLSYPNLKKTWNCVKKTIEALL
ncbi:MAG: NUDIX hydrolase [Clostridia bacterium]|nr:NUDIX hydrolase [Clostridia bacterium]